MAPVLHTPASPVTGSRRRITAVGLAVLFGLSSILGDGTAEAQILTVPEAPDGVGATLGIELDLLTRPEAFTFQSGPGLGFGVRGAVGLDRRGVVDVGGAYRSVAHDSHWYGDKDVRNMIRSAALSARLAAPLKYVRPYVGGDLGLAYFGTETTSEECCDSYGDSERVLETIDEADFASFVSGRVGLLIDVVRDIGLTSAALSLDLGIANQYGGEATYQTGGHGPVRTSGTSYRIYSIGVSLRTR